jgi:hypothetical protein
MVKKILSLLILVVFQNIIASTITPPVKWLLHAAPSEKTYYSVDLEASEHLFESTSLVMQTRYASYDFQYSNNLFDDFMPQMTALWEQSCMVEVAPKSYKKTLFDIGFGYELRRYSYYDIFDDSFGYFWEPSFLIPVTLHLDSIFWRWDASTDLQLIAEVGLNFYTQSTLLMHQMLCIKEQHTDLFFKFFALQSTTSFHDDLFDSFQNYSIGFIFESFSA